jgi:hypothetical protein
MTARDRAGMRVAARRLAGVRVAVGGRAGMRVAARRLAGVRVAAGGRAGATA